MESLLILVLTALRANWARRATVPAALDWLCRGSWPARLPLKRAEPDRARRDVAATIYTLATPPPPTGGTASLLVLATVESQQNIFYTSLADLRILNFSKIWEAGLIPWFFSIWFFGDLSEAYIVVLFVKEEFYFRFVESTGDLNSAAAHGDHSAPRKCAYSLNHVSTLSNYDNE